MSVPSMPVFADAFAFAPPAAKPLNPVPGTPEADDLQGTDERDLIRGFDGRDTLTGLKGADRLEGGDGADTLDGGAGNDRVKGGNGNDTIIVSPGADKIDGGNGQDTLDASGFKTGIVVNATVSDQGWPSILPGTITLADATVQTVAGIENFLGSRFDDIFYGAATRATLKGGAGNDKLEASGERSKVLGGAGNDILRIEGDFAKAIGGAGDDRIQAYGPSQIVNGGAGNDTILITFGHGTKVGVKASVIRGGNGNDHITWLDSDTNRELYPEVLKVFGGAGADTFDFGYYEAGTIQDFQPGIDKVDLSVHLSREDTSFDELMTMVTNSANGAVLTLDFTTVGGFKIVFKGISADDFVDGDFIF